MRAVNTAPDACSGATLHTSWNHQSPGALYNLYQCKISPPTYLLIVPAGRQSVPFQTLDERLKRLSGPILASRSGLPRLVSCWLRPLRLS